MLKIDLILEIMNQIDHYLKEKVTKVTRLMKDELGGKIVPEICWIKNKNLQLLNRLWQGRDQDKREKKVCLKKIT